MNRLKFDASCTTLPPSPERHVLHLGIYGLNPRGQILTFPYEETPNQAATLSMGSDQTISYSASRLTGPSPLSACGGITCVVYCFCSPRLPAFMKVVRRADR